MEKTSWIGWPVWLGDCDMDGVAVTDAVCEAVRDPDIVDEGVCDAVLVSEAETDGVIVGLGVDVTDAVALWLRVALPVCVCEAVPEELCVWLGVELGVGVPVAVGVTATDAVWLCDCVFDGDRVWLCDAVAVMLKVAPQTALMAMTLTDALTPRLAHCAPALEVL